MLVWDFFSGIFHAATMLLLLKEKGDSTGGDGLEVGTDLRWTPLGTPHIVCHIRPRYYIKLLVMKRQKTYRITKSSGKLFLF